MSFLASAIGGVIGGSVLKSIFGGKKKDKAVQQPVPTPTRNMAAEAAAKSDLLAKRRGVVANMVLGAGGAEASVGGGTKLGS
ncbi:hypothetical protein [Sphingopyxis sp. SCN 67-31]|uniref:hypothetical protein n=1 Tax=Sphingopyxis sp. SCN 67-31 TaxID=1660142 RepID=UPI00086E6C7F|nr:hypothetical protein [Sphingopyxis sp. SCN 67-31]ODU28998.1 MAG: hypothetical protein ABS88_10735 [Sphingopyxis sp. SCN 67-31]